MIYQRLTQDYNAKRLYNSYLISTDDTERALCEIYKFLAEKVFKDALESEEVVNIEGADEINRDENQTKQYTHPDLFLCSKEEITAKNISVEQIRKLREFINKSSVISGYKVGIITPADLMNANSANSCLKMLEDTPGQGLVILLTTLPAAILPTIRSRCAKIAHYTHRDAVADYSNDANDSSRVKEGNVSSNNNDYKRFLEIFSAPGAGGFEVQNAFIKEFAGKDRSKWLKFAVQLEQLLGKFVKRRSAIEVGLTQYEQQIYNKNKFQSLDFEELKYKYTSISLFIQEVVEYDLELKASTILLLDHFK